MITYYEINHKNQIFAIVNNRDFTIPLQTFANLCLEHEVEAVFNFNFVSSKILNSYILKEFDFKNSENDYIEIPFSIE